MNPWDKPGMAKAINDYWNTSPLEADWYEQLHGVLKQHIVLGTLLEVGCGSGKVHAILNIPTYIGCDISTEMLKLHAAAFPAAELHHQTDPYKLPFDNESFDTVLCVSVLQHVEHPDSLITELCRVARKKLIVVTWATHGTAAIIQDADGFYQNVYGVYAMMESILRPKMATVATYGNLSGKNWMFCASYKG
jgi:ubiquinone/menaquinone biosynthesis C-methylase UbiE